MIQTLIVPEFLYSKDLISNEEANSIMSNEKFIQTEFAHLENMNRIVPEIVQEHLELFEDKLDYSKEYLKYEELNTYENAVYGDMIRSLHDKIDYLLDHWIESIHGRDYIHHRLFWLKGFSCCTHIDTQMRANTMVFDESKRLTDNQKKKVEYISQNFIWNIVNSDDDYYINALHNQGITLLIFQLQFGLTDLPLMITQFSLK